MTRLVLASASPARLATLRAAGVEPEVVVSGVDEDGVDAGSPRATAAELARRKCRAVAGAVAGRGAWPVAGPDAWPVGGPDGGQDVGGVGRPTLVLGCDSVLELDGVAYGKPGSADQAVRRWRAMRGRSAVLHTGHCVVRLPDGRQAEGTSSTVVRFADLSDDEIAAYVATGEPLAVAGGFTVDGLGGPFVEGVDGDHHGVVGLSLPLLRRLLLSLDIPWPSLWVTTPPTRR